MNYRIDTKDRQITVSKKMPDSEFGIVQSLNVPEICDFSAILSGVMMKYTGRYSKVKQENGVTFIEHPNRS